MNTWTKRITEISLMMLTAEARRNRIAALMDGKTINGNKVASLIDECRIAATLYLETHEVPDAELIREHLKRISGRDAVAAMEPDELADWVLDLKKTVEEMT